MAPPVIITEAVPFVPLKQLTFVVEVVSMGPPVLFTATEALCEQPLMSVTITLYAPANKLVAVAVVCAVASSQIYKYGLAPPLTETIAEPSLLPHVAFIELVVNIIEGFTVIVTVAVLVHPAAEVPVTV